MGSKHSYVTLKITFEWQRILHDSSLKKRSLFNLNLAGHEISGKNSKLIT